MFPSRLEHKLYQKVPIKCNHGDHEQCHGRKSGRRGLWRRDEDGGNDDGNIAKVEQVISERCVEK